MRQADMVNAVPRVRRKHIYANTLKTEKARTTEPTEVSFGEGHSGTRKDKPETSNDK